MAEGRMVDKPFPTRRPSGGLAHVGLQGSLVDEAETMQEPAHEGLAPEDPALPRPAHIRAFLFDCQDVFFYMSDQGLGEGGRLKRSEERRVGREGKERLEGGEGME